MLGPLTLTGVAHPKNNNRWPYLFMHLHYWSPSWRLRARVIHTHKLSSQFHFIVRGIYRSSTRHRIALALLAVAFCMLPWLLILGATLQGQTNVRMWSSTWIGLDCLEIIGLLATSILLIQRKSLVIMTATFTATLFLVDAWFDVMLSQAGADWNQALLSAFIGEIPLSLICFYIALTAPAWIKDNSQAVRRATLQLEIFKRLVRRTTRLK